MSALHKDSGSTTIFMSGMLALALTIVVAIATVAAVHLQRKSLWNYADTIALEISETITWRAQVGEEVSDQLVQEMAAQRIANPRTEFEEFPNLEIGPRTALVSEDQIRVHLTATYRPESVPEIFHSWLAGIMLEVESTANFTPGD